MVEITRSMDNEQIYQLLKSEILLFIHKPGDCLSESLLCQRFNLSRTPMRGILQRLQENGLVQILPRRGTIVTKLNFDIVNQIIYERVAVESMVLRDFIRICSPTDVEKVRYALIQLQRFGNVYFSDPTLFEPDQFHRYDLMMHELWFSGTNKRYLWERILGVQASYTRFCTLDILNGNNIHDVLSEHEEMLRLIEAHDIDRIEPLIRRHLYGGVRRLGGEIFTHYADYFEPLDGPQD